MYFRRSDSSGDRHFCTRVLQHRGHANFAAPRDNSKYIVRETSLNMIALNYSKREH